MAATNYPYMTSGVSGFSMTRAVPPAQNFLPEARVWEHLRLDLTGSPSEPDDAALVRVYRDAVESELDGWSGRLGRALVNQTWEMKSRTFPLYIDRIYGDLRIVLPLLPVSSVAEITYIDPDGAEQTLASTEYTVVGIGDPSSAGIIPAYGKTWPSTRDVPEAVTVTFIAGYGNASAVPQAIVAAGLLMISDLYETRQGGATGVTFQTNPAVERLLAPYIVGGFR